MKELDFLPSEYREKNAIHNARLYQLAMALGFGAIIILAAAFSVRALSICPAGVDADLRTI